MKQIFTYTMFLLVILLSTGCSKENEPDASDKPVPSGEGMSTYVPIDWEQTDIQSFNPETGELSLVFTGGNVPTFEDGYSLLVVETDTSAYIRRVMQSAVSSNIARLQTIGADMTELFSNTEFSFSFTPSASRTETKAGTMASIDANGVLHPVKIVVQAEDGSFQTLYDIKTQTRVEDGSFIDLFNINMSGVAIGIPNGQVKLSWDSFKQQFQSVLFGIEDKVSESHYLAQRLVVLFCARDERDRTHHHYVSHGAHHDFGGRLHQRRGQQQRVRRRAQRGQQRNAGQHQPFCGAFQLMHRIGPRLRKPVDYEGGHKR